MATAPAVPRDNDAKWMVFTVPLRRLDPQYKKYALPSGDQDAVGVTVFRPPPTFSPDTLRSDPVLYTRPSHSVYDGRKVLRSDSKSVKIECRFSGFLPSFFELLISVDLCRGLWKSEWPSRNTQVVLYGIPKGLAEDDLLRALRVNLCYLFGDDSCAANPLSPSAIMVSGPEGSGAQGIATLRFSSEDAAKRFWSLSSAGLYKIYGKVLGCLPDPSGYRGFAEAVAAHFVPEDILLGQTCGCCTIDQKTLSSRVRKVPRRTETAPHIPGGETSSTTCRVFLPFATEKWTVSCLSRLPSLEEKNAHVIWRNDVQGALVTFPESEMSARTLLRTLCPCPWYCFRTARLSAIPTSIDGVSSHVGPATNIGLLSSTKPFKATVKKEDANNAGESVTVTFLRLGRRVTPCIINPVSLPLDLFEKESTVAPTSSTSLLDEIKGAERTKSSLGGVTSGELEGPVPTAVIGDAAASGRGQAPRGGRHPSVVASKKRARVSRVCSWGELPDEEFASQRISGDISGADQPAIGQGTGSRGGGQRSSASGDILHVRANNQGAGAAPRSECAKAVIGVSHVGSGNKDTALGVKTDPMLTAVKRNSQKQSRHHAAEEQAEERGRNAPPSRVAHCGPSSSVREMRTSRRTRGRLGAHLSDSDFVTFEASTDDALMMMTSDNAPQALPSSNGAVRRSRRRQSAGTVPNLQAGSHEDITVGGAAPMGSQEVPGVGNDGAPVQRAVVPQRNTTQLRNKTQETGMAVYGSQPANPSQRSNVTTTVASYEDSQRQLEEAPPVVVVKRGRGRPRGSGRRATLDPSLLRQ